MGASPLALGHSSALSSTLAPKTRFGVDPVPSVRSDSHDGAQQADKGDPRPVVAHSPSSPSLLVSRTIALATFLPEVLTLRAPYDQTGHQLRRPTDGASAVTPDGPAGTFARTGLWCVPIGLLAHHLAV